MRSISSRNSFVLRNSLLGTTNLDDCEIIAALVLDSVVPFFLETIVAISKIRYMTEYVSVQIRACPRRPQCSIAYVKLSDSSTPNDLRALAWCVDMLSIDAVHIAPWQCFVPFSDEESDYWSKDYWSNDRLFGPGNGYSTIG
jgi:hypothetical protein